MTHQRINRGTQTRRRRESEARRGVHFDCPHCGAGMTIRSSHTQTSTMRDLHYDCTNHECGASFAAIAELTYHLSLPAQPNPAVTLPMSSRIDRAATRALLEQSGEVVPDKTNMPQVNNDLFADPPTAAGPPSLKAAPA